MYAFVGGMNLRRQNVAKTHNKTGENNTRDDKSARRQRSAEFVHDLIETKFTDPRKKNPRAKSKHHSNNRSVVHRKPNWTLKIHLSKWKWPVMLGKICDRRRETEKNLIWPRLRSIEQPANMWDSLKSVWFLSQKWSFKNEFEQSVFKETV